ncbi:MAG: xanthine dehydrogenase family protein molybdopterin-binding subunit [Hyphomicrobiales bacterium]|nr:xanthine dehydrogenase family protein molybdopterin-binding subunit [Hyphomicrobiales bacterium]
MPERKERGRSRIRFEDARFLTGKGRYVDDLEAPGALHAHLLRSPFGHALIRSIDVSAASAMPGVAGVFTAQDLRQDGLGHLTCAVKVATIGPLIIPPRPALAEGRVRHVGDPVAFVVARSKEEARDAAEQIAVEYDELPAVTDSAAAIEAGAPLVWDQAPGNIAFRFQKGDRDAVDAAFATAARIVELDLVNNRVVAAPLEPRAAIGSFDAQEETLRLVLTGQGVHGIRDQLARDVFHLPPERIHLVAPDVGGGFGTKNFLYPEWVLVLFASRRLGHPVKWVSDRNEDFLSSAQGRDNITHARLGLDAEGRFLALDVSTLANMGAYISSAGPGPSTNSSSTAQGGVYEIPAVFLDVRGVFTNTVPIDAYRGAGKPEANYVIERLIDLAARETGRSPAELRRRNIIKRVPYRSALGMQIEDGEFAENLEKGLALADHAGFKARRAEAKRRGKLRGLGIACYLETSRGQPGESAGVRFEADGQVALVSGTQSNGQGHETSFPQIAADLLGLPIERFRLVQADTRLVPKGGGHGGARSLHMGGAALVKAIERVIDKARRIAAQLLQGKAEDLVFSEGVFSFADARDHRSVDLLSVARAACDPTQLPPAMAPGLDCHFDDPADLFTFPNGCHVAEVEIDPDTGRVTLQRYVGVDDFGVLINPMLTLGQVHGGLTQGIGQALHEHTAYEDGSGQLMSASFMDYGLPRADDLPDFGIGFNEVPTKANPLGVKGSGQAGCIAAPQTVMNAVLDALAPLGIARLDMPATPQRIWEAIHRVDARAKASEKQ